jgi:hypothetical protein
MTADPIDIAAAAHARILRALATWPARDLSILAAVVDLGPPSALHDGSAFPAVPVERDADPGGVPAMRRNGGEADAVRAALLDVYRVAARLAGHPLPPPGKP